MNLNKIKKRVVLRYWHGEGPLWEIFWLYGVPVNAVLIGLATLPAGRAYLGIGYPSLILILIVLYDVWAFVAIWRCAFNARLALWGYLARMLVVFIFLWVLLASFVLFTYFSLKSGSTP